MLVVVIPSLAINCYAYCRYKFVGNLLFAYLTLFNLFFNNQKAYCYKSTPVNKTLLTPLMLRQNKVERLSSASPA
jgi:hypothetical protein